VSDAKDNRSDHEDPPRPKFLGQHKYGVDQSRRIRLPQAWRDATSGDGKTQFCVMPWPPDEPDHLVAMPLEEWKSFLGRLRLESEDDE
jgi:DNA-binding transcriptional regulator/RsmH inhibitor MraZ